MRPQHSSIGGEEEVENLIEERVEVELGLAGGTGHQIFKTGPSERFPFKQHFLEALPQLRVGILHQALGEVGIGSSEDLELGIDAQGDSLEGDQGADDQRVIRRHPEREFVHHARHVVGDALEVHAIHPHLQCLAEDGFEGWNDRFEIDVFRQESKGDEVLGEFGEIAVDQVHHRLNQACPGLPAHLTHHAEIEVAEPAVLQGEQIARMRVGVKEPVLQQLLEAAAHPHFHHVVGINAELLDGLEVGELHPVDPLHGQHPSAGGIPVDGGDGDPGVVAVEVAEFLSVARFIEVVHLLEHAAAQFIDQGHEIAADQADVAVQPGGDVAHDVQVQRDLFP